MKRIFYLAIVLVIIIGIAFSYEKDWELVWQYPVGKPLPQISIMNFGVPGIMLTKNNLLVVPTWNGKIYCFENKLLQWQRDLGSPIYHDVKIFNDIIFVSTYDGQLHALSLKNGSKIWNVGFNNPITSNIFIYNRKIYLAAGRKIYEISLNGKILKSTVLPTKITMLGKVDVFYLFDNYGRIYRLKDDLQLISFFDLKFNEQNPPFLFNGYTVFTTMQGVILFFKDNIEYNRVCLPNGIISKPIISDDKKSFYILTSIGRIFQVNAKKILNYYDSKFYAAGTLAKYNGKLYFPSIYNKMYVTNNQLLYAKEFNIVTVPNKNMIFDSKGGFYFVGQDGVLYYYIKVMQ